jgi:hypothetical protein
MTTWGQSAGWQSNYWFAASWFGPAQASPNPPTPGGPGGGYGGGTAGGGGFRSEPSTKGRRGPDVEFVFRGGQWVFSREVRGTDDTDLLTIAHLFLMARKP